MNERETLEERFKLAVSSTVKAISGDFNLEIKFGNEASSKKNCLNFRHIKIFMSKFKNMILSKYL